MRGSMRGLMIMALSLVMTIGAVLTDAPAQVGAVSGDKRPNLQMLPLRDWHIQNVNGRRLLRFTSIFVNAGPGPFEVRGRRSSTSDPTMSIRQRMFRWDGTSRFIDTAARPSDVAILMPAWTILSRLSPCGRRRAAAPLRPHAAETLAGS